MRIPLRLVLLYLCWAVASWQPVWAQNLVLNGGFETGTFSSWTQFGNTGYTSVVTAASPEGTHYASFGPVASVGGIFQNLATTIGQKYQISYFLRVQGKDAASTFLAQFGNPIALQTLESLTNPAISGFIQRTFTFTATTITSQIRFTFRNDPSYFNLDGVSVVKKVPELDPSGARLALMIVCLLLLLVFDRRSAVSRVLAV